MRIIIDEGDGGSPRPELCREDVNVNGMFQSAAAVDAVIVIFKVVA